MTQLPYDFPLFSGNDDVATDTDTKTDTPIQWLGKLERSFATTATDVQKIAVFKVNLERGSTAHNWWADITDPEKDT